MSTDTPSSHTNEILSISGEQDERIRRTGGTSESVNRRAIQLCRKEAAANGDDDDDIVAVVVLSGRSFVTFVS